MPEYLKTPDNFQDVKVSKNLSLIEFLILKLIYEHELKNLSTGRANLTDCFSNLYYEISEVKIRGILKSLEKKELINIPKGRSGCSVTTKGKDILLKNN